MIVALGAYIKTITALTIFSALACMLMPDGSFRKYVELVLGVLILTAVLSPFLKLFGTDGNTIELYGLKSALGQYGNDQDISSYEEMDRQRLEEAYGLELEKRVSADIGGRHEGVTSVSVAYCQDLSEEAYGQIEEIAILYEQGNGEKIRKDTAQRYQLSLEQVRVGNERKKGEEHG